ncbi:MAG: hypothetical protein QM679_04365 [Patulibacter sp.]
MSDRFRLGELLATIGTIGLVILLAFGAWLSYEQVLPGGEFAATGAVGVRHIGWFALIAVALAAIAGLIFIVRVLTAATTERPMLQAPVAYASALFALLVCAVRLLIFTPDITVKTGRLARDLGVSALSVDAQVSLGGWLGLGALLLLVAGTWIAMSDERKDSPAAKARTAALLATVPVRPAPPAGGGPATPSTGDSA